MVKSKVETEVRVRYAETDAQGVVYYANYFVWFEVGRMAFLRALGFDYATMEREGLGFVIAEASCRYHAAAHFDEVLTVKTCLGEIKNRSFTLGYEATNQQTGQLLASGRTVQVFIDGERKPTTIPLQLRERLQGG
jgi:acyl-CoA thioester hydrolase